MVSPTPRITWVGEPGVIGWMCIREQAEADELPVQN
jgi:hypothetical protein